MNWEVITLHQFRCVDVRERCLHPPFFFIVKSVFIGISNDSKSTKLFETKPLNLRLLNLLSIWFLDLQSLPAPCAHWTTEKCKN